MCTKTKQGANVMSDYQIRPGDTLSKIAKQYGVTVDQLVKANRIKDPNLIFAGHSLKIPVTDDKAFDIPGLTVGKNPTAPAPSGKDAPVAPTGPSSGTLPTLPSLGGDVKLVYAHIIRPSDSIAPTILPTGGDIRLLYAAPIKPSDGTTPTDPPMPTLPTGGGGDIRLMYAAPINPSGSGVVPMYAAPISPSSGGVVPMYAAPINPSSGLLPTDVQLPTLPTLPSGGVVPTGIKLPTSPTLPTAPSVTPKKPAQTEMTAAEKEAAKTSGKYVAHYLAGYTTDTEQKAIIDEVNRLNDRNVLEFLDSYQAHRKDEIVNADPFFTQVLRESGFDEKQSIMYKVALRLAAHLANIGANEDATVVKNILSKKEFTAQDAAALDGIYQRYIEN